MVRNSFPLLKPHNWLQISLRNLQRKAEDLPLWEGVHKTDWMVCFFSIEFHVAQGKRSLEKLSSPS